ncbi:MAG: citramalate synthase [Pseudonocardia sp.]|nr:citramalate synthase [Pseudonocardia sp.]
MTGVGPDEAEIPDLYDTTLRDGMQGPGVSLTVSDKLVVARILDDLGVDVIEGGWPGAIPRDTDFFRRAAQDLGLRHAVLAAFGATRRPDRAAGRDPQVTALLAAETPLVTIVAKSDSRHVERALRTTRAENLAMVVDTVAHLVRAGRRVVVDAEHFFDGFAADPEHALDVVRAATGAGADTVVLCDTNGGALLGTVADVVAETAARTGARLGIHCHDDGGCAVANTLAAVAAGARHVQVTAHGYGERCGNADLFTVAANLVLKMGLPVLSPDRLARLGEAAEAIAAITGVPRRPNAPYVGRAAFTHKAGLHASALRVDPSLYQHVDPAAVGSTMRTLVSDIAGRASIELKAAELGHDLPARSPVLGRVAERVKAGERDGLGYESADASFELLLHEEGGGLAPSFRVESWEVRTTSDPAPRTHAVLDVSVDPRHGPDGFAWRTATGTGTDAVEALDDAFRQALDPLLAGGCRVLEGRRERLLQDPDRAPRTQVLVTHRDGDRVWGAVGVHRNPVAATVAALVDAYRHALLVPYSAPVIPPAAAA